MKNTRSAGPDPGTGKAVVESFKFQDRVYELRLNSCGKQNCRTCSGREPRHGPYWYLCVPWGGKWRRIYLGKDLDTTKYIGPDGKVLPSKMNRSAQKPLTALSPPGVGSALQDSTEPEIPAQMDLLEESGAQMPPVLDDLPDSLGF